MVVGQEREWIDGAVIISILGVHGNTIAHTVHLREEVQHGVSEQENSHSLLTSPERTTCPR